MSANVAIVLVDYNGWADSIACIESCLALEGARFRIVVCDNDSPAGSADKIAAWARGDFSPPRDVSSPIAVVAPRLPNGVALLDRAAAERGEGGDAELVIVRTGGNLGFAGGNNVGLRWALAQGFTHAWLLNNDTVVPPDALAALLDTMAQAPRTGLCGSLLVEYHAPDTVQAFAGAINRSTFRGRHLGEGLPLAQATDLATLQSLYPLRRGEVAYPVGASMLASRDFLEQIGLMEEAYFLYYEEADWVLRTGDRFAITIAPASRVYHKHGASAGSTSEGTSSRAVGFLFRSRLLIARRFAPARLPMVVAQMAEEVARGLARGRTAKLKAAARALTGRIRVPGQ